MKKLRVNISYSMKELLNEDKENFGIEIGAIGNILFDYYSNREIEKIQFNTKLKEYIQFNLTKKNEEMFYMVLKEQNENSESEYMRNILFTYMNNPRYQRERIIFSNKFELIEEAIKEKKKLNIKYNKSVRTVNPYFIKVADRENRSYLFCYCEKSEDYRCFKVSEIENIMISKSDVEFKDKEYIEKIRENFDPFRSYGKRVKLKITNKGKELLKKAIQNRPKLLEEKDKICIFECDEKLAQIYFAQFFSEIEILEPLSLREWFRNTLEEAYKKYI